MANEIQKFDVTEHIRQKVREVLIASIPDEQMNAMIKAEYHLFFTPNNYGDSPFRKIVHDVLEKAIKEKMIAWIDTNFQSQWDEATQSQILVGEAVAAIAPIVQKAMIAEITQLSLNELRNRLMR